MRDSDTLVTRTRSSEDGVRGSCLKGSFALYEWSAKQTICITEKCRCSQRPWSFGAAYGTVCGAARGAVRLAISYTVRLSAMRHALRYKVLHCGTSCSLFLRDVTDGVVVMCGVRCSALCHVMPHIRCGPMRW